MVHNMKSPDRGEQATPKRKTGRSLTSGKFQVASPYDDPVLLDELVKVVRAIRDLEPMLAASVLMFKQLGKTEAAAMAGVTGVHLSVLKAKALEDLAADPESLREVKKKRVDAKRLGNVLLEEQQHTQKLAREWQLDGVTPERLILANPQILSEVMRLAVALSLDRDEPLPDEVSLGNGGQS